jgi:hypothetical protein
VSLLLFVLVVIGCGKAPETVRETGVFEPLVQRFEAVSASYGRPVLVDNLIIRFGGTEGDDRAVCVIKGEQTPTISVSAEAWSESTEAEQEELLFHELGHCVLRRFHQDGIDERSGAPRSVMSSVKIDEGIYLARRDDYLRELFSRSAEF